MERDAERRELEEIDLPEGFELKKEIEDSIDEYSSQIPDELKRAVDGINGETQWAIIVLLLEEKETPFSELKEKLDIHQQTLSNSLSSLQKGSLITKKQMRGPNNNYSSYYEVTRFGNRFVKELFDALGSGDETIELEEEPDYIEVNNIEGAVVEEFSRVNKKGGGLSSVKPVISQSTEVVRGV